VRAARQNLPLFHISSVESIWLPYEEYILWYYLHPDHLLAAKNVARVLITNPETPDWVKDSVLANWATFFCPECPTDDLGGSPAPTR
jgi:hypothetical protein